MATSKLQNVTLTQCTWINLELSAGLTGQEEEGQDDTQSLTEVSC